MQYRSGTQDLYFIASCRYQQTLLVPLPARTTNVQKQKVSEAQSGAPGERNTDSQLEV